MDANHKPAGEQSAPDAVERARELLPCPFCGREAYRTESVNGTNMLIVGCATCGVHMKAKKIFYPGKTEWTRDVEAAWNQRAASENARLEGELAEVTEQLEFDRSAVADGVTSIRKAVEGREWLTEGRGPYEWNDDNWHKEFAAAAQEILTASEPLKKIAADWSKCPRGVKEVAKARIDLKSTVQELAKALWDRQSGMHSADHATGVSIGNCSYPRCQEALKLCAPHVEAARKVATEISGKGV